MASHAGLVAAALRNQKCQRYGPPRRADRASVKSICFGYDQRFVTHTIATIAVKATAALIGPALDR